VEELPDGLSIARTSETRRLDGIMVNQKAGRASHIARKEGDAGDPDIAGQISPHIDRQARTHIVGWTIPTWMGEIWIQAGPIRRGRSHVDSIVGPIHQTPFVSPLILLHDPFTGCYSPGRDTGD